MWGLGFKDRLYTLVGIGLGLDIQCDSSMDC